MTSRQQRRAAARRAGVYPLSPTRVSRTTANATPVIQQLEVGETVVTDHAIPLPALRTPLRRGGSDGR